MPYWLSSKADRSEMTDANLPIEALSTPESLKFLYLMTTALLLSAKLNRRKGLLLCIDFRAHHLSITH